MPITTGGGARVEIEQAPPLVVSSYVVGETQPYRSERFPVWRIPCRADEPLDYWRGLSSVWDEGFSLFLVEHDSVVDDDLIQTLVDCKWRLATYAYPLHWPSTHRVEPHFAQRTGLLPPAGGEWINEGDEWCDYTGIGFCKIAPEVRVGALEETHWSHLDASVSKAIVGRWRVLWPAIEHDHY